MKRYVLVVEWDTCSNIHVIHHRENFLITAENVFDAINDARKVYERGDLSTYNVVITSVYSEPDKAEYPVFSKEDMKEMMNAPKFDEEKFRKDNGLA